MQVTTNQLRRQEDECKRWKEDLESSYRQNKEIQSKLKEERRRSVDLESRLKEDSVHARIREAEKSQKMFDLSQQISSLKLKNQELIAEKELERERCTSSGSGSDIASDKPDSELDITEGNKSSRSSLLDINSQVNVS